MCPQKRYVRNKRQCGISINLKYIALDAFESRKAELKNNGGEERWFLPLKLHILPKLDCMPVLEITQTKDTQYTFSHLAYKSCNS